MPKERTITGVFVDPLERIAEVRTVRKELDAYYGLLGCSCIDIANWGVGDKRFDIICDDEALLKEGTVASALDRHGRPMLFGPIFVVKFDGAQDETDLTQGEQELVLSNVRNSVIIHDRGCSLIKVLYDVCY